MGKKNNSIIENYGSLKDCDGIVFGFSLLFFLVIIFSFLCFVGYKFEFMQSVTFGVGMSGLIFTVFLAVGGSLGFLFAVPRLAEDTVAAEPGQTVAISRRFLKSNSNLEKVSDWLTTMLVGVGLSQLGNSGTYLSQFSEFVKDHISPLGVCSVYGASTCSVVPAIAPMLLLAGSLSGFVFIYVYTRLVISPALNKAEKTLANGEPLPPDEAEALTEAVVSAVNESSAAAENPVFNAVRTGRNLSVSDALNTMLSLLYRSGGYQEVINLGGKLAQSSAVKTAEYWFYLTAAFGQKYNTLIANSGDEEDLLSTRENALDCARRTVEIDSSFRVRLWEISDPNSTDNDLQGLRDDPEFRRLVRR